MAEGASRRRGGRGGGPAGSGRGPRSGAADPARARALGLLRAVLEGGATLEDADARTPAPPEMRARARRLAMSALRHRSRADAALRPLLRRGPPAAVGALLALSVAEVLGEGAPAHGVVSDAVALARGVPGGAPAAGMVNAVLRRAVSEEGRARWEAAGPPRMPGWLRGRVSSAFGGARTAAIEAAQERGAPLDLTPRDGDAAALAARLGGAALPTGSVRLADPGRISGLPGHDEGAWWVQDAAAALPAAMLDVRPGERVLDLCAAPGGKTMQLAARGARVTALDVSEPRLARLRENLARTGLAAELVAADALEWEAEPFDAVLLDAPCSATGTIRRHPELPLIRGPEGLAELAGLQAALIDRAVALTRPGGRIVCAVCSLLAEEGPDRVADALARHPALAVEPVELPGTGPDWWRDGALRTAPDLWPDLGGLDGFHAVRLSRS